MLAVKAVVTWLIAALIAMLFLPTPAESASTRVWYLSYNLGCRRLPRSGNAYSRIHSIYGP